MRNTKHQDPNTKAAASRVSYSVRRPKAMVLCDEPVTEGAGRHPFDLEERSAVFAGEVVRFSRQIPRNPTNNRLIDQLVGAATSVAAIFCEANDGYSKRDFRFSVNRCIKEAKEARLFLRMIAVSEPELAASARPLYREATELLRILPAMYRK